MKQKLVNINIKYSDDILEKKTYVLDIFNQFCFLTLYNRIYTFVVFFKSLYTVINNSAEVYEDSINTVRNIHFDPIYQLIFFTYIIYVGVKKNYQFGLK